MGKLLLAAPEHMGIIEVVQEGLKKYSGHSVDFLNLLTTEKFVYKHFRQRTYNFFLKNLTGQNIKTHYYNKKFKEKIVQFGSDYDIIVIIRPDLVTNKILKLLRKKTNHFVAYYWDTAKFYPRKLKIRKYFDKIFSFDPKDCKKYGFNFLSNFYYYENAAPHIDYQVYNLSSFDYRKDLIERIGEKLYNLNISSCLKLAYHQPFKSDYIQHIPKVINYQVMLKEIASAQVVLEVQRKNQCGLSFRPFEALGLNKKLITTNSDIKNYDFYDEANILILDYDATNIEIPKAFFETPYKPIPNSIREKYHLKNWVTTLLSR